MNIVNRKIYSYENNEKFSSKLRALIVLVFTSSIFSVDIDVFDIVTREVSSAAVSKVFVYKVDNANQYSTFALASFCSYDSEPSPLKCPAIKKAISRACFSFSLGSQNDV